MARKTTRFWFTILYIRVESKTTFPRCNERCEWEGFVSYDTRVTRSVGQNTFWTYFGKLQSKRVVCNKSLTAYCRRACTDKTVKTAATVVAVRENINVSQGSRVMFVWIETVSVGAYPTRIWRRRRDTVPLAHTSYFFHVPRRQYRSPLYRVNYKQKIIDINVWNVWNDVNQYRTLKSAVLAERIAIKRNK